MVATVSCLILMICAGVSEMGSLKHNRLVTIHMPEGYYIALRELVERGYYPSVSEAIRAAIRKLLARYYVRERGGMMIA